MRRLTRREDQTFRAVVFGVAPCMLGLGAALFLRASDTAWLTTAGGFWPVVLTCVSAAILIKLSFSRFDDGTTGIAAWLTLAFTWFYAPLWLTAVEVPRTAAIVDRAGRVQFASDTSRYAEFKIWLMTNSTGNRVVDNVIGAVAASGLTLEYRYSEPFIAKRGHHDDLAEPLASTVRAVLKEWSERPRGARIAMLDDPGARNPALQAICQFIVGQSLPCPITMRISPASEATALGSTWSKLYTETEAIAERHLPTLIRLLTQFDTPLADRDKVFATFLTLADSVSSLSQVAQRPHGLTDDQFDEVIRRVLESPECGTEAVALVGKANRLKPDQRSALKAKAYQEASVATLIENAAPLRIADADLAQLAARMQTAFAADPNVAVRALEVFGERMPAEVQRDAVASIARAKSSYALAALRHVNFSSDLRQELVSKVLADADYADFSTARVSKESLQGMLSPGELRSLIAMTVKKSETSSAWLDFALSALAIREMTPGERTSVLTALLFKSPKAALEFASENRRYLDPAEVDEVTRDYTRTIATDLCLHLSHRNKNRATDYFSERQLRIFRDCAQSKP